VRGVRAGGFAERRSRTGTDTLTILSQLARTCLDAGKPAQCLSQLDETLNSTTAKPLSSDSRAAFKEAGERLAQLYDAAGQPQQAREWRHRLEPSGSH